MRFLFPLLIMIGCASAHSFISHPFISLSIADQSCARPDGLLDLNVYITPDKPDRVRVSVDDLETVLQGDEISSTVMILVKNASIGPHEIRASVKGIVTEKYFSIWDCK